MSYTHLILVEGKTDKKLIEDLVEDILDEIAPSPRPKAEVNSIEGGGKDANGASNLGKQLDLQRESILFYVESGLPILLLLDADKGDLAARRAAAMQTIADKQLPVDLFLIPDDQSNGAIETLMAGMISDQGKPVFACWESYIECLKEVMAPASPHKEDGFFAYAHVMGVTRDKNYPHKRNYRDQDIWNLNAAILVPLREKLAAFLTQGK